MSTFQLYLELGIHHIADLGVEAGQIMILLIVMLLSFVLVDLFRAARRDWNLVLSGAAPGLSLVMVLERMP